MANFSDDKIETIWQKAQIVENYDSTKYRKDVCGAWIAWADYGKETDFGWEIDHTLPTSKGGTDHAENLRAMHWKNNRSKADDFPRYRAAVIAFENKNVESSKEVSIHDEILARLAQLYPHNSYLLSL